MYQARRGRRHSDGRMPICRGRRALGLCQRGVAEPTLGSLPFLGQKHALISPGDFDIVHDDVAMAPVEVGVVGFSAPSARLVVGNRRVAQEVSVAVS